MGQNQFNHSHVIACIHVVAKIHWTVYLGFFFFLGWLYDGTGSYDISFHVAGAVVAFSGAILYIIPVVQKLLGRPQHAVTSTQLVLDQPEPTEDMAKEVEMSDMKKS